MKLTQDTIINFALRHVCRMAKELRHPALILSLQLETQYSNVNPLKPAALTISNFSFCIYVFRMILTVNSGYFLKHRYPVDLCNGEVLCFLCGTD
jgi:uncharacterized protein with PQ loop repeat